MLRNGAGDVRSTLTAVTPAQILIEAVGWAGAVMILAAYILLSLDRLPARSVTYQLLNIVGAAGFTVNGIANHALPSATLNVIWMAIGVLALWRMRTSG